MPAQPPTGTVTLLFTVFEGSTPLWEQHPDMIQTALPRHDALLHAAIQRPDFRFTTNAPAVAEICARLDSGGGGGLA